MNRGGNWNNDGSNERVAYRNNNTPSSRNNNIGARLSSSAHILSIREQSARWPPFTDAGPVPGF